MALAPLVVEQSPPSHPQVRWKKPPVGVLRLNWDAALNKETKTMGVGAVIRNEGGGFVAALSKIVPFIIDPLLTETVDVWYAAQFVHGELLHVSPSFLIIILL